MTEKERNKELCERFPFLIPYSIWTGEIIDGYEYEYTILDEMPGGWRTAFGEQMCQEVLDAISINDWKEYYHVVSIKEKYGELVWHGNFTSTQLMDVLEKYTKLSRHTCITCGKPATKISLGWIAPYCDRCAKLYCNNTKPLTEDEYENSL